VSYAEQHHSRSTTPRAGATQLSQEIDQYAVDFSSGAAENSTPRTVSWVNTTFDAARAVIEESPQAPTAGGPRVYLLEVTGGSGFTLKYARNVGGAAPSGPLLLIVVDVTSWQAIGYAINKAGAPAPLSLSELGASETDSLSGVNPISTVQFRTKYHVA